MNLAAVVLSTVLAATEPGTDARVQSAIRQLFEHWSEGRVEKAYAQMSPSARRVVGQAQLAGYLDSRRRLLGNFVDISAPKVTDSADSEEGTVTYAAEVRFAKGSTPAQFIMSPTPDGWRIKKFWLTLPSDKPATYDTKEIVPVANEMLALVKREGLTALADRFSEETLAAADQTPEYAKQSFHFLETLLGSMERSKLREPAKLDEHNCTQLLGSSTFEHTDADVTIRLCWEDGLWSLAHAQFEATMTPKFLERTIAYTFKGVLAECPGNAAFPVGGEITCRLTQENEPTQDALIKRTTKSGFVVVALSDVPK